MSALRGINVRDRIMSVAVRHEGLIRVLAVIAGAVLWLDFFIRVLRPALVSPHFPTSTYWVAPRLVLEGRGHLLFDPPAFAQAALDLGAFSDLGFIPNAPPGVLPLLPLGLLIEATAYPIWTVASVACLLVAVALLVRWLQLPATVQLVMFAALPLFHPLRYNLSVGQGYAFVLLAVVASATTLGSGRPMVAGLAHSAVAILKLYYGFALLVPALFMRRWRLVAVWAAVLAGAAAVSALLVGPGGWSVWLSTSIAWRALPQTTVTAYQTLNSLFGHLFRHDAQWNPAPVVDAPAVAAILWLAAAAILAGASAAALARGRERDGALAVALVVPVAVLLSPIAEDYHYVLAIFPLIVAGTVLARSARTSATLWLLYMAAILLIVPAWRFNRPSVEVEGWWALLFYPRVYGAILVWLVLLVLVWQRERTRRGAA